MNNEIKHTPDGWEIQYIDPQEMVKQQIQAYINVQKGFKTPAIGYTEELTMEQLIERYGNCITKEELENLKKQRK